MTTILGFLKGPGVWLFVGLAVFGWYRTELKRAEARGEAKAESQRADSLAKLFLADSASRALRDSTARARQQADSQRIALLATDLRRTRQSRRRSDSKADSLVAALADRAAAEAIRESLDTLRSEADQCSVVLLDCETARQAAVADFHSVSVDLATAEGVVRDLRAANDGLEDLAGRGGGIDLLHIGEALAIVLLTVLHFTR